MKDLENAMVTGYAGYGGDSKRFDELKIIDTCVGCGVEITEQDEYYTDGIENFCSVKCFCDANGLRKVNEGV